jgi:hypothetical protein
VCSSDLEQGGEGKACLGRDDQHCISAIGPRKKEPDGWSDWFWRVRMTVAGHSGDDYNQTLHANNTSQHRTSTVHANDMKIIEMINF